MFDVSDVVNPLSAAAAVPLVVTVTVPFPNMEPFLGSVENYAVWDTRVFLLAGVYTVLRAVYLLKNYVFTRAAAAVAEGAEGGH